MSLDRFFADEDSFDFAPTTPVDDASREASPPQAQESIDETAHDRLNRVLEAWREYP